MVYALVISERIKTAVDPLAYVADGLPRGPHVYILYVSLQPCQGRQTLIAGLTSEFFGTWRQKGPQLAASAAHESYLHALSLLWSDTHAFRYTGSF